MPLSANIQFVIETEDKKIIFRHQDIVKALYTFRRTPKAFSIYKVNLTTGIRKLCGSKDIKLVKENWWN